MPRYLMVVNAHSGGGRPAAQLDALLAGELLPEVTLDLRMTEGPGHAERLVREAAGQYDLIVAVGGDGTVGEVASGLLLSGQGTPMALLPRGTGNDIGHGLGIRSWADGLAALRDGGERPVDVIRVVAGPGGEQTRLALLGIGVGFPAELLRRTTKRVKRICGRYSYHYAALAATASVRSASMSVTVDGARYEDRYLSVAVTNMAWTAGQTVCITPDARYDDGLLDVVLVRESGRLRRLALLRGLRDGRYLTRREVTSLQATRVAVEAEPPAWLNIDGDLVGRTPAAFELLPAALRVRVPRPTELPG